MALDRAERAYLARVLPEGSPGGRLAAAAALAVSALRAACQARGYLVPYQAQPLLTAGAGPRLALVAGVVGLAEMAVLF